jgi:hypothetical protein
MERYSSSGQRLVPVDVNTDIPADRGPVVSLAMSVRFAALRSTAKADHPKSPVRARLDLLFRSF